MNKHQIYDLYVIHFRCHCYHWSWFLGFSFLSPFKSFFSLVFAFISYFFRFVLSNIHIPFLLLLMLIWNSLVVNSNEEKWENSFFCVECVEKIWLSETYVKSHNEQVICIQHKQIDTSLQFIIPSILANIMIELPFTFYTITLCNLSYSSFHSKCCLYRKHTISTCDIFHFNFHCRKVQFKHRQRVDISFIFFFCSHFLLCGLIVDLCDNYFNKMWNRFVISKFSLHKSRHLASIC